MSYAEGTSVSVLRSREEISKMLEKAKCARSWTAQEDGRAIVGFELEDRRIEFTLTLPSKSQFATREGRRGLVQVSDDQQSKALEQACRERWRGLVLALKAKFVAIELGVETVEEAFLAHVVLSNKQTVYRWFRSQLEKSAGGPMPGLLQLGSGTRP